MKKVLPFCTLAMNEGTNQSLSFISPLFISVFFVLTLFNTGFVTGGGSCAGFVPEGRRQDLAPIAASLVLACDVHHLIQEPFFYSNGLKT
jgi:hypothetical protein